MRIELREGGEGEGEGLADEDEDDALDEGPREECREKDGRRLPLGTDVSLCSSSVAISIRPLLSDMQGAHTIRIWPRCHRDVQPSTSQHTCAL